MFQNALEDFEKILSGSRKLKFSLESAEKFKNVLEGFRNFQKLLENSREECFKNF
jgi:hypothetical protein